MSDYSDYVLGLDPSHYWRGGEGASLGEDEVGSVDLSITGGSAVSGATTIDSTSAIGLSGVAPSYATVSFSPPGFVRPGLGFWLRIPDGAPESELRVLRITSDLPGSPVFGKYTTVYLYVTEDGKARWQFEDDGLPSSIDETYLHDKVVADGEWHLITFARASSVTVLSVDEESINALASDVALTTFWFGGGSEGIAFEFDEIEAFDDIGSTYPDDPVARYLDSLPPRTASIETDAAVTVALDADYLADRTRTVQVQGAIEVAVEIRSMTREAVNARASILLAAELSATVTSQRPVTAPVTEVQATPGVRHVRVVWAAVAVASGYRVRRNGSVVYDGPASSFVDYGVADGTTYTYTVTAYGVLGESAESSPVVATSLWPPAGSPEGSRPKVEHLAFPLELRDGQFVTVEQGSPQEIAGNARLIASCPRGWIDSDPAFGIPNLALTLVGDRPRIVQDAVNQREPRARALADEQWIDLTRRAVRITTRLRGPADG